jgi:hypothetical protein
MQFKLSQAAMLLSILATSGCDVGSANITANGNSLSLTEAPSQIIQYNTGPAAKVWEKCAAVIKRSLNDARADPEFGYYGAVYAGHLDGICIAGMDQNAHSLADVAYVAKTMCEEALAGVTCHRVYAFVPKGHTSISGRTLGHRATEHVLGPYERSTGYGAVAISADGAYSIKKWKSSREEADKAALDTCNDLIGRGQESMPKLFDELKQAGCKIVHRKGPDYPASKIQVN